MESNLEMTIADYDRDIAQLELTLLDMRRKRNTLTRMHTIPVEILTKIMAHVFNSTALSSINEYTHDGEEWEGNCDRVDWSWRSLMLVCQRFRDVAVACPQLWSIVDRRHVTRWTRLCQSRMSGYPDSTLLGEVQGEAEADAETVALLKTVRHAQINSRITQESQYLPMDQMFPSLRSLCLGGHARGAGDFIMTSQFLGGRATGLTHLVLDYSDSLSIDDAPSFPALHYLNLRHFVTDMQGDALRLLLSKTPQLRSLVLRYLQRKRTNDATRIEPRRTEGRGPLLPHLTYLRWTGPLVPTLMATVIPEVLEDSFQLVVSHVAPDDTLFAFVCGLISQHDHRRLKMSPSRAWSLTEVSCDPEGSKVILESIAETPSHGPKITIPSSWENAFVLLDQVDTLHLESSFALCMYKDKIVRSETVQHLYITLSEDTSRWRMSFPQLLSTVEGMCAARAGAGRALDTIYMSFDSHHRKEAADLGVNLDEIRSDWIRKGWVSSITFA